MSMKKYETTEERKIYLVTLQGALVNIVLSLLKLIAGIVGHSAAIMADAVHSLSDLMTDFIVLIMVKIGRRPKDSGHDYGHGKFETLATAILGILLLIIGFVIAYRGMRLTVLAFRGLELERPGYIALIAALMSILLKEWAYRFTLKTARKTHSPILVANAWHHRSDSFSSIGTFIGILFAIVLGEKWRVLDPITAVIVSIFILRIACRLIFNAISELLEASLPSEVEDEIMAIAKSEEGVSGIHHLMTRRIGKDTAIEMHIRVPGNLTVEQAHDHATNIEKKLKERFGEGTHVGIHVEPLKPAADADPSTQPS